MANQSAKKQLKENQALIQSLITYSLAANAAYILIRIWWFYDSFSFSLWLGFFYLLAIYALAFWHITATASPTYVDGELIDGGGNLHSACEYSIDAIYINIFMQFITILFDWFWWLYLIVPGFVFYKLWVNFLQPYFFPPTPVEAPETEEERKRREKKERQAQRPKYKVFR